jgi:hypothetical protein
MRHAAAEASQFGRLPVMVKHNVGLPAFSISVDLALQRVFEPPSIMPVFANANGGGNTSLIGLVLLKNQIEGEVFSEIVCLNRPDFAITKAIGAAANSLVAIKKNRQSRLSREIKELSRKRDRVIRPKSTSDEKQHDDSGPGPSQFQHDAPSIFA